MEGIEESLEKEGLEHLARIEDELEAIKDCTPTSRAAFTNGILQGAGALVAASRRSLSLAGRFPDWMLNKVTEFEREEVSVSQSEVQNLSDSIKANEARMEKLVSTYLDGDIAKEMYLTRKDALMRAILALKEKKKDFERGRNNWVEPLRNWILDLKQANFLSTSNDFHEIKSFVQKIGTNPLVRDKSARFEIPIPSQFVAERRHLFPTPAPSARGIFHLSDSEVSICGVSRSRTRPFEAPQGPFGEFAILAFERSRSGSWFQ